MIGFILIKNYEKSDHKHKEEIVNLYIGNIAFINNWNFKDLRRFSYNSHIVLRTSILRIVMGRVSQPPPLLADDDTPPSPSVFCNFQNVRGK